VEGNGKETYIFSAEIRKAYNFSRFLNQNSQNLVSQVKVYLT